MVGIIPKEERSNSSENLKSLLYLAVFLLLLSLAAYFLLTNSLKKTEGEAAILDSKLEEMMSPEKITLEKEILNSRNKIEDFSQLLKLHLKTSKVFGILEETTHPQVWFTDFNLNPRKGELIISGETDSFETLGQQILILKEESTISEVNLQKVSINEEGKINFGLLLLINF